MKDFKKTIQYKIVEAIKNLEIGETMNVNQFLEKHYGYHDFFNARSLDVSLHMQKENLRKLGITYKRGNRKITRLT